MKKAFCCLSAVVLCFMLIVPNSLLADEPKVFKLGFMTSLSGTFAVVGETQKAGTLLAVEEINKKGGLNMPWGKVKVEALIKDDETKLDTGVRRFRELVGEGINGIIGTTYAPMAAALNEECKISKIPFLPACVPAYDAFKKGNPALATYSVAATPWSIGYLVGGSAIKTLGKKKIFYQSRSDSWGNGIHEGLKAACKEYGGEIIGFAEVPKGTIDYTSIINKAIGMKPDIFITCMFASDAIAVLKQAYELGLYKVSTVFNAWITNVVATGIPENALNGLYALEYYYYDMSGFNDPELVKKAESYSAAYVKMWGEPPDAYGTIAYIAATTLFAAVEKAGSFDTEKIAEQLKTSKFDTVKGEGYFREDHEMVFKYLGFLVKGKAPDQKKGKWDVFTVEGSLGGESALPPLKDLGY